MVQPLMTMVIAMMISMVMTIISIGITIIIRGIDQRCRNPMICGYIIIDPIAMITDPIIVFIHIIIAMMGITIMEATVATIIAASFAIVSGIHVYR